MELAPNGDLKSFIKNRNGVPLDELVILDIFKQLLEAVNHLHANEILHRDIKPANIFFGYDYVKLGDLGIAKQKGTNP